MTDEVSNLRRRLLREAEEAEQEWDRDGASAPVVRSTAQGDSPSQVYSLRIPAERIARLRQLADDRGVKATVLMRSWVLERLEAEENAYAAGRPDVGDETDVDSIETLAELRTLLDSLGVGQHYEIVAAGSSGAGGWVNLDGVRLGAHRRLASPLRSTSGSGTREWEESGQMASDVSDGMRS